MIVTLSSSAALAEPSEGTAPPEQPVPSASFETDEEPKSFLQPPPMPPPRTAPSAPPPDRGVAAPRAEAPPITAAHEPPPVAPTPIYRPQYLDYRGYLAVADAAALGLWIGAFATENAGLGIGGLAIYLLGGPIIHGTNGQGSRAAASAGFRLGLPVIGLFGGLLVGGAVCDDSGESDFGCLSSAVGGALVGTFVGTISAMVVDDVFLGKVELPRVQPARLRPRLTALGPVADPKRGMLGMTLTGTF
jgi:hypothetical protein